MFGISQQNCRGLTLNLRHIVHVRYKPCISNSEDTLLLFYYAYLLQDTTRPSSTQFAFSPPVPLSSILMLRDHYALQVSGFFCVFPPKFFMIFCFIHASYVSNITYFARTLCLAEGYCPQCAVPIWQPVNPAS